MNDLSVGRLRDSEIVKYLHGYLIFKTNLFQLGNLFKPRILFGGVSVAAAVKFFFIASGQFYTPALASVGDP